MNAEIRTLKDGETTVYPRTLASAVYNDDGTTIDTTIQKAVENTTQLTGNIDTVLENVLTGESVVSLNSELDNINGEVVGTDTTAKLDKIESTKAAISQAISDKGVDMSSVSVFGDYAGKIASIENGSPKVKASPVAPENTLYPITEVFPSFYLINKFEYSPGDIVVIANGQSVPGSGYMINRQSDLSFYDYAIDRSLNDYSTPVKEVFA